MFRTFQIAYLLFGIVFFMLASSPTDAVQVRHLVVAMAILGAMILLSPVTP